MSIEERRKGTEKARAAMIAKYLDPIGLLKRFWTKVDIRGIDECWPWKGVRYYTGYGCFRMYGHNRQAHRAAYELTYGSIDPNLDCCHHCDNRPCCNPSHLVMWPTKKNIEDMIQKGRHRPRKGEENGRCKLNESQVREILKMPEEGFVTEQVARDYGVSGFAIYALRYGKSWKHIPRQIT